jgi:transposase
LTIVLDSGYHKNYLEEKLIAIYPDILTKITFVVIEKMSKEEKKEKGLKGFVPLSKRWIVERSNSWMDKCRILWKNCESQLTTSTTKIKLCFIRLILRRLCRSG